MRTEWFQNLGEEDKQGRVEQVLSARPTLNLLKQILEGRLELRAVAQLKKSNYEHAAWPYEQADYIAEQRVLREVIDLITLTKEDV